MRLGIFGGTFDPPHIGHLILASEAQVQLRLTRVLWVLTPDPPHKQARLITPLIQRLELMQAALGSDPVFELSMVDIDRPPPHFAVDTIRLLRKERPEARWIYLMGSDSLDDLPDWHNARQFVLECDEIGVMCRPDREPSLTQLEKKLPGLRERVRFLEAPLLEISSTSLRLKITAGGAYRYYLPPAVCAKIEQSGLYRSVSPKKNR